MMDGQMGVFLTQASELVLAPVERWQMLTRSLKVECIKESDKFLHSQLSVLVMSEVASYVNLTVLVTQPKFSYFGLPIISQLGLLVPLLVEHFPHTYSRSCNYDLFSYYHYFLNILREKMLVLFVLPHVDSSSCLASGCFQLHVSRVLYWRREFAPNTRKINIF